MSAGEGKPELTERLAELKSTKSLLAKAERQVEKLTSYNEDLRKQVETLSAELHQYRHVKRRDVDVQVDKEDLLNYTSGEVVLPDWSQTEAPNAANSNTNNSSEASVEVGEGESLSLADSLKATAEAALQQTGFVYDENSGLYYDYNSGYYYDSEKSLYYEPNSGTYFYYDPETQEYQFHSQVDVSCYSWQQHKEGREPQSTGEVTHIQAESTTPDSRKQKEKEKKKKKRKERLKTEEVPKNRKQRRQELRERLEKKIRKELEKKKKRKAKRRKSTSSHRKKRDKENQNRPSHRKHKKRDKHARCTSLSENSDNDSKPVVRVKHEEIKKYDSEKEEKLVVKLEGNSEPLSKKLVVNGDDYREGDICTEQCLKEEPMDYELSKTDADDSGGDYKEASRNTCPETDSKSLQRVDEGLKENIKPEFDRPSLGCVDLTEDSAEPDSPCSGEMEVTGISRECLAAGNSLPILVSSDSESELQSEIESGELTMSDSESDSDSSLTSSSESESESDELSDDKEVAGSWPPCVRVIVTESDCLEVGTLFIVTCMGGTLGREKDMNHAITIPDINISKMHAEIQFSEDQGLYLITDKGSQNGTYLNSQRIGQVKSVSESTPLSHGDTVQLGETKLLCHIHSGTDTCDDCEPGIVMANFHAKNQAHKEIVILSKEEKIKLQRTQLKQIKQKYGLKNAAYVDTVRTPGYTDKAEQRRQAVGSDNPYQKTEAPASVHRAISSGNKGHQLLKKMGWSEGESLGKDNSGIQEPITVSLRTSQTAGLGSRQAGSYSVDSSETADIRKAKRRLQAQQRYERLEAGATTLPEDSGTKGANTPATNHPQWTKGETQVADPGNTS